METPISLDACYRQSDDVVVREIEGEIIIVPLVAGIGDTDDALFTLNETGKTILQRLDGVHTLREVVAELIDEYDAPEDTIVQDVLGLVAALSEMHIVTAVTHA